MSNAAPSVPGETFNVADDTELVRRVGRGDEAAFRVLVDREARYLYGVAHALMGNVADVEDVVQETFIAAANGRFRGEASVRTWLVKILVRRAAMFRRKRRRGPESLDSETVGELSGEVAPATAQDRGSHGLVDYAGQPVARASGGDRAQGGARSELHGNGGRPGSAAGHRRIATAPGEGGTAQAVQGVPLIAGRTVRRKRTGEMVMTCSREGQVHRYHDGELPASERESLEAHLHECAECRQLQAELQQLSALVSRAVLAEMPAELVGRVRQSWPAARDRGVLRLASWMTAAAAAVLIGAVLIRQVGQTDAVSRPAIWETVAVTPPVEVPEEMNPDLVVMAQWMADDLSSERQW